jgi:hypothetical protein
MLPESLVSEERQPSKNPWQERNSGNENMGRDIGIVPAITRSVKTAQMKFRSSLHFYFFML